MINSGSKSNRLLASRRYTHDSFTDAQESFTNVLDLQASEIYTQASKIPSSGLPFSGSSQQGQIHTDSGDNILRYYYRHKLTKSNLNNEVWFFLNPTGSASGIGAQLIDSNQQTSFISPKYSVSSLANATTEDSTPGYLAKVFMSTAVSSASVSDGDAISVNSYQFDYKTGVLQFMNSSVDPSDSQYVYMSVYQYVGKTLAEGVEITGDISGSASSTGSFGHLIVAGNITASGTVRADAFESVTGGDTIDFKDSVSVTGDLNADNLTADSASFSTRITTEELNVDALQADSASFSTRLTTEELNVDALQSDSGSFSTRLTTEEANVDALQSDSASFSTRLTTEEANVDALQSDSGSFSTRITAITSSISALKTDSGSFSTRVTDLKSDSGSFSTRITADSSSISTRLTTEEANVDALQTDSGSFSTRITTEEANVDALQVDSASFSTRVTAITQSISALKTDSGSFSLRINTESGSFSTRVTNLKSDSGSFSTRTTFLEGSGEVQSLGTTDSVQFNNITASGDISGSATSTGSFGRVEVAGDSSFTGNVTIGGNIQIGDADSDSLTIAADLTSNLIPNVDSTFDLGSPTKYWRNQYIDSITATGNISSSLVSTGSIAHLHVANNIGVGTQSPLATVHISASDGLIIPVGNTSQRSSNAIKGEIRFNDQLQSYEGYDGANWGSLGGMTDVDQDTKITAENSAGDDNDELKFFTAGDERLRITADGHISASGNITASSNLRVDGDLIVSGLTNPNISNFSSSLHGKITAITSSISALKVDSGSFSTRLTRNEISASDIVTDSASFSTRVTDLKSDSGSFSTRITTEELNVDALQVDSASFSLRSTAVSSSVFNLKADSGSFSLRVGTEEINVDKLQTTASALIERFDQVQSLGKTDNVLFSSITASDDVRFQSDLIVDGKVTAQEFHTEVVSSSIIFTSGSTKFGDSIDDDHLFTGSLFISGNLTAVNLVVDSSSVSTRLSTEESNVDALQVDSASFSTRVTDLKTDSGSFSLRSTAVSSSVFNLKTDSGSFSARISTEEINVDALQIDSGSFSERITTEEINVDALQTDSGSFSTRVTAITSSISALKTDSESISTRLTTEEANVDALQTDSGSFSTRITVDSSSISARLTTEEANVDALQSDSASFSTRVTNLKTDSGSFSTRVTNLKSNSGSFSIRITAITSSISELKTDSGSFSLRETNLETTSSALINNFDQIQSLGKIDSVVFSNITASNNTQLAGNVLMQSELNVLSNITASGNISSSKSVIAATGSFGFFKIDGDLTAQIGNFTEIKTGENIEIDGRTFQNHISMKISDGFQYDENNDYMPASTDSIVVDPNWAIDEDGNIYPRSDALWTDDAHTYFES